MYNMKTVQMISKQLPLNTDKQYVRCVLEGGCKIYYPAKTISDKGEVQYEYMNKIKEMYQEVIDTDSSSSSSNDNEEDIGEV